MTKQKPQLTLVPAAATVLTAPSTLGTAGRQLWDNVQAEIVLIDAGGLALLEQIRTSADRAAELAAAVERDGATLQGRTSIRVHPGIAAELSLRAFIARGLARLGLLDESVKSMGRPPSSGY